jgi:hypothetical protein
MAIAGLSPIIMGRWLSPDLLGLGPDTNPYRSVGNSPTNGSDPRGELSRPHGFRFTLLIKRDRTPAPSGSIVSGTSKTRLSHYYPMPTSAGGSAQRGKQAARH